jgi:hypothetical protein
MAALLSLLAALLFLPACNCCMEEREWAPCQTREEIERIIDASKALPEMAKMTEGFRRAQQERDAFLYYGGFYFRCP